MRYFYLIALLPILGCTASTNVVETLKPSDKPATPAECKLDELPDYHSYRIDPYLRAAEMLQSLGKDKAVEMLKDLAIKDNCKGNERVFILCKMLFTRKKGEFRSSIWFNMETVDGIPFLIQTNITLSGMAEQPYYFLQYCLTECEWSKYPYHPKSDAEKKAALKKLLTSYQWKKPFGDSESMRKQLEPQLQ